MYNLSYVSSTFETSGFSPNPLFIVCSLLQESRESALRKFARKPHESLGKTGIENGAGKH